MYNNLIAIQAVRGLSNEEMGNVIGISRQAYAAKMKSECFKSEECWKLCAFFDKPFEWLFARDAELGPRKDHQSA